MYLRSAVITSVAELEALRPEWEALLARSASDEPMLLPIWLLAWWRTFGGLDGRRLAVVTLREGDRLVGLAPLVGHAHRYAPGVRFTRLALCGTGEDEVDEVCSEYVGVIAERGTEGAVAEALSRALVAGELGRWDELVLVGMDGSAAMPAALAAALRGAGIATELEAIGSAPYIELPGSFADYLRGLSSSSRYLVTRSLRDFERWSGGEAELSVARTPAELAVGRSALLTLHGERWGDGGAFASPRFRAFHDEVMPALLARGALLVAWLSVRGAPVAAAYGICWRDKVYFYQAGRSLEVPRGVRPGIALHAMLVRRAIEAGLREYDFLEGHSRYKRKLATATRSIVRLRAVRDPLGARERARALAERARIEARLLRRAIGGEPDHAPPSVGPATAPGPPAVLHGDLNMLRCFAGTGVRTVVLSSDPDSPTFFSRHCGQRRAIADVHTDPEGALDDLLAVGRLFSERAVLFYGDDAMLLLVSRNREALGQGFRFLMPPADMVEALVDKRRFAALAEERGLGAPRTVTSDQAASAAEIARLLPPPWIVKPFCHLGFRTSDCVRKLGVGPIKALAAPTEEELARTLDRIKAFAPGFVVQEHIPGGEEHVHTFHAYLDARGRSLGAFVGRKIRTYPRHAGTSTYLEIIDEPELCRLGLEVTAKLGLVGVVKLDYKRDPRTGRFHLLEVNPRFSLWNHLGTAAGLDLPLLAYRDLTGAPQAPERAARAGVRWLALGDDARTFFRCFARSGDLSLAGWLGSLRGPKVYDVFAWDDPAPLLSHAVRALRRAGKARGAR